MKRIIGILLLASLFTSAVANDTVIHKQAVSATVQNLFVKNITVWVNGTKTELGFNSAYRIPCQVNDKLEIQVNKQNEHSVHTMSCGEILEIN